MQVLLFAIGQVLCLAFLYYLPFYCAKTDAKEFKDNPADDSYGKKFHKQRLVWRTVAALLVSGICSIPLLPAVLWVAISTLGLLAVGGGFFFYVFNVRLSLLRQLSYVDMYYVSFSDTTAYFPDKWIANRVMKKFPGEPTPDLAKKWRVEAAKELEGLMAILLFVGSIVYIASLTFILIHLL